MLRSPQIANTFFDQSVSISPQAHAWLAQRHCVQLELREEQTFSCQLRLDKSISLLSVSRFAESKCNEVHTDLACVGLTAVNKKLSSRSACACSVQQATQLSPDVSRLKPELQQEWHFHKNTHFSTAQVNPFSFQTAVWRCPRCHHEWEQRIIDRACTEVGCQHCAEATTCAQSKLPFMSQWNYRRNGSTGIHPAMLSITSSVRVFWICRKCPQKWAHEFEASPLERTKRPHSCCPQCEGKKACICNEAPRGL